MMSNLVTVFATFMLQKIDFFKYMLIGKNVEVAWLDAGEFRVSGDNLDCVKSLNPSDWGLDVLTIVVATRPECRITITAEKDPAGVPTECGDVAVCFGHEAFVGMFRMKLNTLDEECNFEFDEIEVPPQYESDGTEF